jgi:hypothetical protein
MKAYLILTAAVLIGTLASCKKDQLSPGGKNGNSYPARKVRYELYTRENFAGNRENIQFNLFMRTGERTILDSSLATMKVEDIPDSAHRIVIEKFVPGNDTSTLAVGFVYHIENVGISWYLETFAAGDTLKVLRFPFR